MRDDAVARIVDLVEESAPGRHVVDGGGEGVSYATKAQSFAAADLAKRGAAVDYSPPVHQGAYADAIDRPDDVMRGRSELTVRKGTAAACLVTLVDSELSRLPACKPRPKAGAR